MLGQGPEFFANAKRLGLEGVVSKRRNASYRSGRTTDWLKSKAVHRQEFVVCGFILREGTKDHVGWLILCMRSQVSTGAIFISDIHFEGCAFEEDRRCGVLLVGFWLGCS